MNDPEVLQNPNSILDLNFLQRCDGMAKSTRENIVDPFGVDHICRAFIKKKSRFQIAALQWGESFQIHIRGLTRMLFQNVG